MTGELPMRFRDDALPPRVRIHEVGPRDGLQNEPSRVPVAIKAEFIHRLADAGLTTVEATSFVRPDLVPQLADAAELMPLLGDLGERGVRLPVLVPNERGLERALALGVREVAVFASVTESFARANLNRTVDESLTLFEPVVSRALRAEVPVRGYLSMCFGDPWEGRVPADRVVRVALRLLELGCTELSLGDTIGVATPGHVAALLTALNDAGIPATKLAVHFHDTYGQALSNTLTALRHGVTTVDASAGGSAAARSPRAPRATSPPRTCCGCSRALASTPASTCGDSPPPVTGWPHTSAGPARRAPSARSPTRSPDPWHWTTV